MFSKLKNINRIIKITLKVRFQQKKFVTDKMILNNTSFQSIDFVIRFAFVVDYQRKFIKI